MLHVCTDVENTHPSAAITEIFEVAFQLFAVEEVLPRILDALNAYLRAIEPERLTERSAHYRLRGQILRRVRIVTGEDAVLDLLITELVLT